MPRLIPITVLLLALVLSSAAHEPAAAPESPADSAPSPADSTPSTAASSPISAPTPDPSSPPAPPADALPPSSDEANAPVVGEEDIFSGSVSPRAGAGVFAAALIAIYAM